MVVWMSAWPIHSCTRRMSALAIILVPNVWRRSWKRRGRSPAAPARSCSGDAALSRRGSRREAAEDEIVLADQCSRPPSRASAVGDVRRQRHRPDLARLRRRQRARGIACPHSDHRTAKSTSRQRSANSSPGRRPVNAAVRKIAASCSEAAARTSAQTSSGENTWISPLRESAGLSTPAAALPGRP